MLEELLAVFERHVVVGPMEEALGGSGGGSGGAGSCAGGQ